MSDVLAIVGSTWFSDRSALDVARSEILGVLDRRRPDMVISGGAEGIDTLGVTLARELGIPVREYLPRVKKWDGPGGFQERNRRVAGECSRLVRIACRWSPTFGSGWTLQTAKALGVVCWNVELPRSVAAGMVWVQLPAATVALVVRDGVVVDAPPYVRKRWMGRPIDPLMRDLRRRKLRPLWIPD